jgi:hypothetical protein
VALAPSDAPHGRSVGIDVAPEFALASSGTSQPSRGGARRLAAALPPDVLAQVLVRTRALLE